MKRIARAQERLPFPSRTCFTIKNKGITTIEYVMIFILVVSALLAMQVYVKRGLQGKLRSASEELGQQYDPRNTVGQSDFYYSSSSSSYNGLVSEADLGIDFDEDGVIESDVYGYESDTVYSPIISVQTGSETVGPMQ